MNILHFPFTIWLKVGKTQEGGVELCFQKRFFLTKISNCSQDQSLIEFRVW